MQPALTKRWKISPPMPPEIRAQFCDYPPFLSQLLYNRGFSEPSPAKEFLDGRTPDGCDPFAMLGMAEAVARLSKAVQTGEPVAVYGDYDVDGVTATALLVQALRALGAQVREYIPNRFDEGYGLNNEALDGLAEAGVRLVVTVDCGIRSVAEAHHARELGLDLIISDHHHPRVEIPPALAVINPKQDGDTYPDKNLTGVGLAYKLAQALFMEHPVPGVYAEEWLDLVALGTVADLAPLIGENRSLVRRGLNRIHSTDRQGLFSLANVAGLDIRGTTASDIGFILGPRLNAAGRLESAQAAYRLLMAETLQEAGELALLLDDHNKKRKLVTREIEAQVEQLILTQAPDAFLIIAMDSSFNSGVVGLAASHLSEAYHRPAIVGWRGEEYVRCSCRSIPEFHITAALDQCADLLIRHGGHAAAAGFTVSHENLPVLIERLQAIAAQQLAGLDLQPVLTADVEIPLRELGQGVMEAIDTMQPYGFGNPEPVFVSRNVQVRYRKTVGKEGKHLKLTVTDGWVTMDAIAFGRGSLVNQLPDRIDLMYTFERNEYMGRVDFQLKVRDLKAAGTPG